MQLSSLAEPARVRGFSGADRAEASRLLRDALQADRAAIEEIRGALALLGES